MISKVNYLSEISDDSEEQDLSARNSNRYQNIIQKIKKVLNIGLEKLKIASILENLLLNTQSCRIKEKMTKDQRQKLFNYCSSHLDAYHTLKIQNAISEPQSEERRTFIDYELMKAVDLIYHDPELKEHVLEFNDNSLYSEQKQVITSIQKFFEIANERLQTSLTKNMRQEKFLHHIYHENEKMKQQIPAMKSIIHEKEINLKWKITVKNVLIDKFTMELEDEKEKSDRQILEEVKFNQEKIEEIRIEGEQQITKLHTECNALKLKYEDLLMENNAIEIATRKEKKEILFQLQNWIKKYESDIGKCTAENKHLSNELQKKIKEFNEFLHEFKIQEIKYFDIVTQKEIEEKLKQEEKMMLFMMNRAATLIQRAWHKYIQKRKKKSKGRKSKKSKK